MPSIADRRRTFHQLHESGCFVMPNPYDAGSAVYLQSMGFKALASTSAGFAFTRARPDGGVPREAVLEHLADLVAATDVPINADFENGYAHAPDGVAESVRLCVETGVAGLSIEDNAGGEAPGLYAFDDAVARVRAARAAIDGSGGEVVFTARCEAFLVGRPDLDETIGRLKAYADAGADCLYAPGLRTPEQIGAVVQALAPKPVNVLVGWPSELTVSELAGLGVRRISIGAALARAAWGGFVEAAREIAEQGTFKAFAKATPGAELNGLFSRRGG